jgi:hypothetical protein
MIINIITRVKPLLAVLFIILASTITYGCNMKTNNKGAIKNMKTYYIGRFCIEVPAEMVLTIRSSKLRRVDIQEVLWPKDQKPESIRNAEWERFMEEIEKLDPPEGTNKVIIKTDDLTNVEKWIKGVFFHDKFNDDDEGTWTVLMDARNVGVWLKSNPVIVEKELAKPRTIPNFEIILKAYQPPVSAKSNIQQADNQFYLQYGAIDLPYLVQEASIARFEGNSLFTKLLIEMEMDVKHEIEPMGLIKKTRGLLAAALITPGGSISKVRLNKREVAGMPGEEAVLKVREGNETELVFTWEYNGKDDSGEYPTTRINMESPDGNLDEKLKIWDAVLDSMKPMFERKK